MPKIAPEAIPDLKSTDVLAAKSWFEKLSGLGLTFHADDSVEGIPGPDGEPLLSDEAARKVDATMSVLHEAARGWSDPDFIYSLAGEGRFALEADYPGFVIDKSIPDASRLGYVSVPGEELPTVIVEDMGEFVALQFGPAEGKLSEATVFRAVPVNGVRFGGDSYVDVSGAELLLEEAREADSMESLTAAAYAILEEKAAARRAPAA